MAVTLTSTPRQDGFRMPGEFEPHAQCWMLWPERGDVWRLGAKPAQKVFVEVAKAIAEGEPLTVGASPRQYANARRVLPDPIRVVEIENDDAWMRDTGPTFVVNGSSQVRGIDWEFNAWGGLDGGLYFPWDQDRLVARKVIEIERFDRYEAPLVLEGGSIHVDGEGTLLTTEECLLNPNRNPRCTKSQIENTLIDYLNLERIIWLPRGVHLDETSGHIDELACFVRPGVVALTWTDDKSDPQHEISAEAYDILRNSTDAKGRPLDVHKLHQPDPVIIREDEAGGIDLAQGSFPRTAGTRLAASYVNHYAGNGIVVMPFFGGRHDEPARAKLAELCPGRKVIPVTGAREIALGGGNIHCITQQQPLGRRGP